MTEATKSSKERLSPAHVAKYRSLDYCIHSTTIYGDALAMAFEIERLRAVLDGLLTFRDDKDSWGRLTDQQIKPALDAAFRRARSAIHRADCAVLNADDARATCTCGAREALRAGTRRDFRAPHLEAD